LVTIAALATFTAITSFGITRYRIAVDVMLPILAAVTLAEFYVWIRGRHGAAAPTDDGVEAKVLAHSN
jgi:hypothetical protein